MRLMKKKIIYISSKERENLELNHYIFIKKDFNLNKDILNDDFSLAIIEDDEINKGDTIFLNQIIAKMLLKVPFMIVSHDFNLFEYYYRKNALDVVYDKISTNVLGIKLDKLFISDVEKGNNYSAFYNYDVLTGIFTKNFFLRTSTRLIEKYENEPLAMVCFDINNFKLYNTTFGYSAGDNLLITIAKYLEDINIKYPKTVYGRIESDIFALCCSYDDNKLMDYINCFIKNISNLTDNYSIKTAIGIYMITDSKEKIDSIYDKTKLALKACKANPALGYYIYDDKLQLESENEKFVINNFKIAMNEHQFEVYIQPKYNLLKNGYYGGEALVRWNHPEKGMISPGSFIPILEENGFIYQLDYYVWEEVLKIIRNKLDNDEKIDPISVNVSRLDLNANLADTIINLVKKYEVPVDLFNIEITESAYTERGNDLDEIIDKLHAHGFKILMDDFGSGYSSLNALKDIDIDILKVDLNFLSKEGNQGRGETILVSVIRMARYLNLPVIVEGVETEEQAELLKSIGCQMVQGYLYAKPLPVNDYFKLQNSQMFKNNAFVMEKPILLDKLWSTDSEMNLLFKNLIGAVAVYEFSNGHIDLIKFNDEYMKLFQINRDNIFNYDDILSFVLPDYKKSFTDLFEKALVTDNVEELIYKRYDFDHNVMDIDIKIKLISKNENVSVFYGSVDDITKIIEANKMLDETNKAYDIALKESNISVWELDLINNKTYSYPLDKKNVIFEKYPEDSIRYNKLDTISSQNLINLVSKLKSGVKAAHADLKITDENDNVSYTRLYYDTIFENNKPVKAIGHSIDLSKIMYIYEYYNKQQLREKDRISVSNIYLYIDLSSSMVLKAYQKGKPVERLIGPNKNIAKYFKKYIKDNENTVDFIDKNKLLEDYYMGKSKNKYELLINKKYYRLNTIVFENPNNKHIEAIIYSEDITVSTIIETMRKNIICTNYKMAGVLDIETDDLRLYQILANGDLNHVITGNYDSAFVEKMKERFKNASDIEFAKISLEKVKEEVHKGKYMTICHFDEQYILKLTITFLIEEKNKVMVLIENISFV